MRRRFSICIAVFLLFLFCSSALAIEYVGKATTKLTVYSKADTGSKTVTTAAKNDYISILSIENGWAKVKVNGKTGYTKSSAVSKTSRVAYIKAAYVVVYASNSTSSKKLAVLGYGADLKVTATNDGWAQVKYKDSTGYCKASHLTFDNPNGSGTRVYTKNATATFYEYPSGSASTKTIKSDASITYYCTYSSDWCRVKVGSTYGYIKKKELSSTKYTVASTKKTDNYSTATPASAKSVSVDWFKSSISSTFGRGTTVVITDVKTGISWKVKRTGGLYHVDAEPLTTADTTAMKKACGSDYGTWHRRAVWISIGSKKYAASMNCMPHGSCKISDNGFNGVFCIHFENSKTHCSEKVDPDHQACIKAALKAG